MERRRALLGILCNEISGDHLPWVEACEEYSTEVEYRLINFTGSQWLHQIRSEPFDALLARPSGLSSSFKRLYDERIEILDRQGYFIYPSPQELYIYENKRYLYSWLEANRIPHPRTRIFYNRSEADSFVQTATYPIVAKTNIGASGSGVMILTNRREAASYLKASFGGRGAPRRWGPDIKRGGLLKRAMAYAGSPLLIREKIFIYRIRRQERQHGFVILQDYIPHDYEWRVVVIGDSLFAHKKIRSGYKASGTLLKCYGDPPLSIFDFSREIMEQTGFYSQAIDILEDGPGNYLINELQCIFGQSDPWQMKVGGVPGRYRYIDGKYRFEAGDFNMNQSFNLRLEHLLSLMPE